MRKAGGIFALFFLALGILIGLGIDSAQTYISRILMDTLQDEAKKAGGFSFAADSVDISLLTLSGTARGARLEAEGKPALWFKRIDVHFSIAKILERQIILDLTLRDGHAIGVDAESPTFRFIDSLSAPIPPEHDRPNRIKIKLRSIRLVNGDFEQAVPVGRLVGSGAQVEMVRDEANNFVITPALKTLTLELEESDSRTLVPYTLGEVSGSLYLRDEALDFRELALTYGQSRVSGSASMAIADGQPISGSFGMSLASTSLPFPSPVSGSLAGPLRLTKRAAYPLFQGSLSNPEGQSLTLPLTPTLQLSWPKVQTEFEVERTASGTRASLTKLAFSGGMLNANELSPVTLFHSTLTGKIALQAKSLALGSTQLEALAGTLDLTGTLAHPSLSATLSAGTVTTGGIALGPIDATISVAQRKLTFRAKQSQGLSASQTPPKLQVSGAISLDANPLLEESSIQLSRFTFGGPSDTQQPTISGSIRAQGPLNSSGIAAQGNLAIAIPEVEQTLDTSLKLERGKLVLQTSGFSNSLRGAATIDLAEGRQSSLSVTASDLNISSFKPQLECAALTGALEYDFNLSNALSGSGNISLGALTVGCKPYQIALAHPTKLAITQGEIQIQKLDLISASSALTLSGSASLLRGPSLKADGTLELAALIGFLPKVDTLSGTLTAHATTSGNWSAPTLAGTMALKGGTFGIESVGIAAERINGSIELKKDQIAVQSLSGLINAGRFAITGDAYLGDLGRSSLELSADHITIEPQKDVSITTSGHLALKRGDSGGPRLSGVINLESGEIRQRFDLPSLVRLIAENLLSRSRASVRKSELPNIELDLTLSGTRNLFLLTNVAAGEFAANIVISGTLGKPLVSGEVKTLAGWVGLKNRRFEVTSGILTFSPSAPAPTVELLGEAYLPSRTGEFILALLEVRGPLTGPKFKFSSDRGIPESQILQLLTQSGTALRSTRANTVSDLFEDSSQGLLEALASIDLKRFWQGLTRIDSLSIEPVYNQLTGAIEPALVAEKKLARRLNLRGESTFGGTGSISRAKLVYDLARSLAAEGLIETDPTKRVNPLEANLIFTILSRNPQYLKISISGNDNISALDILEAIRVTESSRVPIGDLGRVETALRNYYRDQGYLKATANATCEAELEFCKTLALHIDEGSPSIISGVALSGDPLPEQLKARLGAAPAQQLATAKALERIKTDWTAALRNEGYIGARVFAEYKDRPDSAAVDLDLDISLSRPVSFVFRGNTAFSASDFLETINLFGRKQPFGNNTIAILTQNMERLYREAGYLYASISSERLEDQEAERVTYLINVVEEQKIGVSAVRIEGTSEISEEQIISELRAANPELVHQIFKPKAAVTEELEFHSREIQEALVALGYPDASVAGEIEPDEPARSVRIKYRVTEGPSLLLQSVQVRGFPTEAASVDTPHCPCSVVKINDFTEALRAAAREAGFLFPSQSLELDAQGTHATIAFTPGGRTMIGHIQIEGNRGITQETILSNIRLRPGDPWRSDKIDDSRRELLRLGVFSRVDIAPVDGQLDSVAEALKITVVERPLQTLEVGAGANSEYGLHLFGEASDRGLFADGRSLALRFDTYWNSLTSQITQGVGDLRYTNPKFLASPWTLTENVRFQRLDLPTLPYNLDRLSLASYLTQTTEGDATFSLGHTIFEENLNDVDQGSILSGYDTGSLRLSLLGATAAYDKRDNPLNPSSGFYTALDYRLASDAIGSDANFQSVLVAGSIIEPLEFLSPALRLALNARAGSSWAFAGSSAIPISQRYFLGGRTTVRGYRENSLGPRADDGSIIGGDMLLLGNSELRYSLTDAVAMHLFLDSGSVFLRDQGVSLGDLRYSTGAGVRYLSPIGPVGIEVGCPIARQTGESAYRIHFTIGNNF